jgi:D-alanyl-D-alanine carboxypeptidase
MHPASRPNLRRAACLALAIVSGVGLTPAVHPSPVAARVPSGDDARLAARLEAVLEAAHLELGIPGLAACIRFADGTFWSAGAGFADVAAGRFVEPDTPFGLASVSKTFTAAEVMALVGEGRLHLGESVARLLPGTLVGGRPLDPRISVRQLLDHTSGLPDFLTEPALGRDALAAPDTAWDAARALAYATDPQDAPGTVYRYANTNYVLLGLVVESVTGRPLPVELRERFFEPLGLASAVVQGREAVPGDLPVAYRAPAGVPGAVPPAWGSGTGVRPYLAIVSAAGPAGDIAADACDTARWIHALFSGRAIDPALVGRMVDDARRLSAVDIAAPYGLGVQARVVGGHPTLGHSGRLGHRSSARYFPGLGGLTIVVLTNESRDDPGAVLLALLEIVAAFPVRPQRQAS